MITPEQIQKKSKALWRPFLQAWLRDEPFFPKEFPVGKLPMADFEALREGTRLLINQSKPKQNRGYRVALTPRRTTKYGSQDLPSRIYIDTEEDYLAIVHLSGKFQQFKIAVQMIRSEFPQLEEWVYQHPIAILKHAEKWEQLLAVCDYFCRNPQPNLYIRELPIPIHTKFIEQHKKIIRSLLEELLPSESINADEKHFQRRFGLLYDEALVRIRFLDRTEQLSLHLPFDDLSIPVSQLAQWNYTPSQCLIVENKMTFLTLPDLPNTLALWGGGFRVSLLNRIQRLGNSKIIYWGDLDAHGLQILSSLRHIFPDVISIMMDRNTLDNFADYIVPGMTTPTQYLPYLTEAELTLYQYIQQNNIRLEQEHLSTAYVQAQLQSVLQ